MERKFLAVEKAWLSNPNLSLLEKLIVAQVQEYSRNRRECYMTDSFKYTGQSVTTGVNAIRVYQASSTQYNAYSGGQSSNCGGEAHNNMPPYLAVYMWKRTA